jgi:hypothetical protein
MRKTFEVVDDFYRNPMLYRERALEGSAPAQRTWGSSAYGGPGANDSLDNEEAARRIFQILGWGSDSASGVRVLGYSTFVGDGARDPMAMRLERFGWAGLVCLSLPESRPCGIGFYRRGQSPQRATAAAATLVSDPVHQIADRPHAVGNARASGEAEAGRVTIQLRMRFNRLVLFQTSALGYVVSTGSETTSGSDPLVQFLALGAELASQ